MLAPCPLQALDPPPGHANLGAVYPARGRPCWRCPPCKPLFHRRTTPTSATFTRRAVGFVGALPLASPCSTVGPRQPRRRLPGARSALLALPSLQALDSSSGHANLGAVYPARGRPCWRCPPCKPLNLRRATPIPAPFSRRAAGPECVKQKTQEFPSTSLNE